jgi:hypothetical protein
MACKIAVVSLACGVPRGEKVAKRSLMRTGCLCRPQSRPETLAVGIEEAVMVCELWKQRRHCGAHYILLLG